MEKYVHPSSNGNGERDAVSCEASAPQRTSE
jgi:hypothetical protein